MGNLRILISLTTNDNDYQVEQASAAEQAARKHGIDLRIIYSDNDAINQSTQILKVIQEAEEADRPDAIISSPLVEQPCRRWRARPSTRVSPGWS